MVCTLSRSLSRAQKIIIIIVKTLQIMRVDFENYYSQYSLYLCRAAISIAKEMFFTHE